MFNLFVCSCVVYVNVISLANLNIEYSDSRSANDSMEKSQCVKEQDYSQIANTEEQSSQNELHYKRAELISNGRLKGFFCLKIL